VVAGQQYADVDVSAAGLSVEGGGYAAAGRELDLELDIPDHEPPLRCRGTGRAHGPGAHRHGVRRLGVAERDRLGRFIFAVRACSPAAS
jgi:hypothetical protein